MSNQIKHRMTLMPSGYGHYEVTTDIYGKPFTFITTNMPAIDDYRSDEYDRRELRTLRGYRALRSEAMRKYRGSRERM